MGILFNRIKNAINNINFKSKRVMLLSSFFVFAIATSVILISYGAYINNGSKNLIFSGTATWIQSSDVVLKVYLEDYSGSSGTGTYTRKSYIPTGSYYTYNSSLTYCTSGLSINSFDTTNKTFDLNATGHGYCKVYFDVTSGQSLPNSTFRLYVEQTQDAGDYMSMSLLPTPAEGKVNEINEEFTTCSDENAVVSIDDDNKIVILSSMNIDCDIYVDIEDEIIFTSQDFPYTGEVEPFVVPATAKYKLEVWGAQGGTAGTKTGGMGGYSYGTVSLNKNDTLYIYIGGHGISGSTSGSGGGFNGGGITWNSSAAGGGGATDIRINTDSLYARVIVAGGGGGVGQDSCATATTGYGGGTTGGGSASQGSCQTQAAGGTQTAGGTGGNYSGTYGTAGSFGQGGDAANGGYDGGGGGGGWYGGGSGASAGWSNGGGGGSGYVYTSSSSTPTGYLLNASYYMINAATVAGNVANTIPTTDGTGYETGHAGDGYARITLVS